MRVAAKIRIQHKMSRKVVWNTRVNTILVGDLSVKQMPQSKQATPGLNRSTQNAGHLSRFVGLLTCKAALAGKRVITTDEHTRRGSAAPAERFTICRSGNALWTVNTGTASIETTTVRSTSWWGSYHNMPCGRATGSSPVICDNQTWKFQDTRRKPARASGG